jgi:hypothetical protein
LDFWSENTPTIWQPCASRGDKASAREHCKESLDVQRLAGRVARCYFFIPKIKIWVNLGGLWNGIAGVFHVRLGFLTAI